MLLLDLLDDIIVIVFLLDFGQISESGLAHSKAWLLDDEVRIFLLFLYYSSGDIAVDEIVAAY